MSGSSVEELRSHLKVYIGVFVALACLTLVTVLASQLHVSTPVAIGIALIIATIKASLVACYFMHLISERGLIFGVLIIMAIFFLVLLLIPVFTESEAIDKAQMHLTMLCP